ncbi:uncharacterized protein B0H18DRAFT_255283 [Fomitopsis serialis]|uniref:uncharacterized protein n=1 Tax=Fomitopsis serialis TaxID=139415 RepID=UPI0020072948|nr:uncharacterized protein B0H18DRAFT_255283 [Neoantrodia serialis]KAH9928349.1 hypothetical protein B0H18DRAFT_255283 [Neoantrodia serialis]
MRISCVLRTMSATTPATVLRPTLERVEELRTSLAEISARVQQAAPANATTGRQPTLVAVSKYKPASDILACYEDGQRDFGENYVQELVDKAAQLPADIRWHFIGTFQTNKSKILASIPNLYAVQTVGSAKGADALNKQLTSRTTPLNVLLQVNTSGEDVKSGLAPLTSPVPADAELVHLARHIVSSCPHLHLQGLMTIGSLTESLDSKEKPNEDFEKLKQTRDLLEEALAPEKGQWGEGGRLLLSMGMSSDFEAALRTGSDIVRVGTGIFGGRPKKEEVKSATS